MNNSNCSNLKNLDNLAQFIRIISGNTIDGFESELIDYLMSLPSSIDEFYKIIGEHYVSEIMRSTPEIQSPTQLMRELITGRKSSLSSQSDLNLLVYQMMGQWAHQQDPDSNETSKLESNFSPGELESLYSQTELKDNFIKVNYKSLSDQDNSEEHPNKQINNWIFSSEVHSSRTKLRKREIKLIEKEENDLSLWFSKIKQENELNKEKYEANWKIITKKQNKLNISNISITKKQSNEMYEINQTTEHFSKKS